MDVHSSITHESQEVETIQMPIKGWMDKQIVIYTHNGILISHKKGMKYWHATLWMNFKNIMLSERGQTQKVTHCMIPLIWNIQTR